MHKPNLQNWQSDKSLDGLLFFAQLVDEMLFDYTIDSYKPPVFNTHSLFDELLDFIANTEADYILQNNSGVIIDELLWNLKHDNIAKVVLDYKYDKIVTFLEFEYTKDPKTRDYKKIYAECEIAINLLNKSYISEIKNQLIDSVKEPKEKKLITDLTRKLLSELIYWGYSKQYIYHVNQIFFFHDRKIQSQTQILEFLEYFSFETKVWEVCFKGNTEFEKLKDITLDVPFKITHSQPSPRSTNTSEITALKPTSEYPIFLIFEEIYAYDPFHARLRAEQSIFTIINLAKYKEHTISFDWDKEHNIVYLKDSTTFWTPGTSVSPLGKIRYPTKNFQDDLSKFSRIIHNIEPDSGYALINSLNFHNCAIQSATDSNQLINMWIALETLLPQNNSKKRGMSFFVDVYVNVLGKEYVKKLILDLLRSFNLSLSKDDYTEIFSKLPSDMDDINKCALLLLPENETLLKDLLIKVGRNPLLIFRVYQLTERLWDAKNILEMIQLHDKRIEWHLFRIYRARNEIVHKGEKVKIILINQLLENMHSYYHITIDLIENIRGYYGYSDYIDSFEAIFNLIKFEHEMHINYLKELETPSTELGNYKKIFFGITQNE
jgi:hypothetical protein